MVRLKRMAIWAAVIAILAGWLYQAEQDRQRNARWHATHHPLLTEEEWDELEDEH